MGSSCEALVKDPTSIISRAKIFGAKYVMCAWTPRYPIIVISYPYNNFFAIND